MVQWIRKWKWKSLSCVRLFVTPMDYTVHGILQARILEWKDLPFSRGIFPTQGSSPGLPHCRQIISQLSHKGSPRILEWVAYPFSSRSSWSRNWIRAFCVAGRFFPSWALRESACQCRLGPWSGKTPRAVGQLSPCATSVEPVLSSQCSATREVIKMGSWCTVTKTQRKQKQFF